jgi:hypothetical protein
LTDVDVPAYACAPSCLLTFLMQLRKRTELSM